jgi:hypothetical protein
MTLVRGPAVLYLGDRPVAWLAVEARPMASQATETWLPRCPKCGRGTPVLAPANGFTRTLIEKTEIYCAECQWRGSLADHLAQVYVRS